MNHLIIAKFKPEYTKEQKQKMLADIKNIFDQAKNISGIYDVEYKENCTNRSNRYDLLINIKMDSIALPLWDESPWHAEWKKKYGQMLESKCIFDYE